MFQNFKISLKQEDLGNSLLQHFSGQLGSPPCVSCIPIGTHLPVVNNHTLQLNLLFPNRFSQHVVIF